MPRDDAFATVEETSRALGVSTATVWRRLRSGELPSVVRGGRRLVPRNALARGIRSGAREDVDEMTPDHPIFRLVGAGRSGGRAPGARDKHAILDGR